jgi:hypothetical protein
MTDISAAGNRSGEFRRIPVIRFGQALSSFFILSYVLCILGYLALPDFSAPSHQALSIFLPGFTLLSWHNFFLGLIESFAWGWYIALLLGPLYNFFVGRRP